MAALLGKPAINTTASATSLDFTMVSLASSDGTTGRVSSMGVSTSPGMITLDLIPVFLNSTLRNSVKLITAALAALYATPASGTGATPAIDATFIIVPLPLLTIAGTTAWVQ